MRPCLKLVRKITLLDYITLHYFDDADEVNTSKLYSSLFEDFVKNILNIYVQAEPDKDAREEKIQSSLIRIHQLLYKLNKEMKKLSKIREGEKQFPDDWEAKPGLKDVTKMLEDNKTVTTNAKVRMN